MAQYLARQTGPLIVYLKDDKVIRDSYGDVVERIPAIKAEFLPGVGFSTDDKAIMKLVENHAEYGIRFFKLESKEKVEEAKKEEPKEEEVEEEKPAPKAKKSSKKVETEEADLGEMPVVNEESDL